MPGKKVIPLKREKFIKAVTNVATVNRNLARINPEVSQTNKKCPEDNKQSYGFYAKQQIARPKNEKNPNKRPEDNHSADYDEIQVDNWKVVQKNVADKICRSRGSRRIVSCSNLHR